MNIPLGTNNYVKTSNMNKLSFYRKYKSDHKIEKYITLVNKRRHRSALAKLRSSAHRIKIEIGRYIKVYNEHTTRYEQLRENLQHEKIEFL